MTTTEELLRDAASALRRDAEPTDAVWDRVRTEATTVGRPATIELDADDAATGRRRWLAAGVVAVAAALVAFVLVVRSGGDDGSQVQIGGDPGAAATQQHVWDLTRAGVELANALGTESVWSVAAMTGAVPDRVPAELTTARASTDDALTAWQAAVDDVGDLADTPFTADQVTSAQQRLAGLATLRRSVDEAQTNAANVIDQYTSTASAVLEISPTLTRSLVDGEAVFELITIQALAQVALAQANLAGSGLAALSYPIANAGMADPQQHAREQFAASHDRLDLAARIFEVGALPSQKQAIRDRASAVSGGQDLPRDLSAWLDDVPGAARPDPTTWLEDGLAALAVYQQLTLDELDQPTKPSSTPSSAPQETQVDPMPAPAPSGTGR